MQIIKVYDMYSWDGTDRTKHAFYLTDKAEAEKWVKGYKHDSFNETTIELFDSIDERQEWLNNRLKEKALAKLTPDERKALGF